MMADSFYAKMLAERKGGKIIEDDFGYLSYRLIPETTDCYLIDMYVVPSARAKGHGRSLVSRLVETARLSGSTRVTARIFSDDDTASNTLLAALMVGFKPVGAEGGSIYLAKEIEVNHG